MSYEDPSREVLELTKEMEERNFNGLSIVDAAAFYIVKRWGIRVGEQHVYIIHFQEAMAKAVEYYAPLFKQQEEEWQAAHGSWDVEEEDDEEEEGGCSSDPS